MKEQFRIDKRLYEFNAGCYCGVFMPEHVMKKLVKLNDKYNSEVRKLLDQFKDELYLASWTLANSKDVDGKILKQITIKYCLTNQDEWNNVDRRIKLFKTAQPEYLPEVYLVNNREQADAIAEEVLKEKLEEEQNGSN